MQIFHGLPDIPLASDSTLTIGVFDGVHLGHQSLIHETLHRARALNRLCGVLTFDPHPVEVLAPNAHIRYLSDIEERTQLVGQLGVDFFCVIPFTDETSQTSARDFVRPLVDRLHMRDLFIGYDFTLGHKRQGNADFLRALGAEWGFTLQVVQPLMMDGEIVSSTRIRNMLREGRVEQAARLLGHPAGLSGRLTSALNLEFNPNRQIPADGVYDCLMGERTWRTSMVECTTQIEQNWIRVQGGESVRPLMEKEITLQFVKRLERVPYEEIAHTADVAIRVRGHALEALFCHAAQGMFALMTDLAPVLSDSQYEIDVEGFDRETLLVNWLSELLYQAEINQRVFREFEVRITPSCQLHGVARGGPSAELRKQIKAVTFHDLHIEERDGYYETTIVFDV